MSAILPEHFPSFRFDQPKGFARICGTKFWERVAYYGLQSILILYLTEYLLVDKLPEQIWFLGSASRLLDVQGQALASTITGCFLMLVSIIPILGGIITDRYLGQRRAIIIGGSIIAAGHLLMAVEYALLLALLCIVLGVGLFRGAIASQFGMLYDQDSKRVEGFQFYFLAVNIAALLAPLLVGTIGEGIGWHWGFATSGAAMIFAMIVYRAGTFRATPALGSACGPPKSKQTSSQGSVWKGNMLLILGVGLIAIPNFQLLNAYMLWVKRDFELQIIGYQIPVSWLIGLDAALSLSVLAASVPTWHWIEERIGRVTAMTRASIGSLFVTAGILSLVVASAAAGQGKISLFWCVAFQLFNAVGLAQILPAAMARLCRRENSEGSATSISGYYFGLFIAGLISTFLATRFETVDVTFFWLVHLAFAILGVLVFFLARAQPFAARLVLESQ